MTQPHDDLCALEESLRVYVHQVVTEPMSAALRLKLSALRIPLN